MAPVALKNRRLTDHLPRWEVLARFHTTPHHQQLPWRHDVRAPSSTLALCLVERGHLKETQLAGLSSAECRTVVEETERSLKQAKMWPMNERKAMTAETPVLAKSYARKVRTRPSALSPTPRKSPTNQSGQGKQAAKQAATAARVAVQPKDKVARYFSGGFIPCQPTAQYCTPSRTWATNLSL